MAEEPRPEDPRYPLLSKMGEYTMTLRGWSLLQTDIIEAQQEVERRKKLPPAPPKVGEDDDDVDMKPKAAPPHVRR
jgi:hypothetical protein